MSFASQLEAFAQKTNRNVSDVRRQAAIELATDIIDRTPVDKGFAKGSWTASVGSEPTNFNTGEDISGQTAISKAVEAANSLQGDQGFYLFSNLKYMPVLEYGLYGTGEGATSLTTRDGFSIQAPNGMVRVAVRNFKARLRRQLKKVSK